jgi:hypothetical protein
LVAAAQDSKHQSQPKHHHYQLVDTATFGGPKGDLNTRNDGTFSVDLVNKQGALARSVDTATPDPFPDFCFDDCYVAHAFSWEDGIMTDLGALAHGVSSLAFWISGSGLIAGVSQNGEIDPLIAGFPELRAVVWRNGVITDLGTQIPMKARDSGNSTRLSTTQIIRLSTRESKLAERPDYAH